MPDADARVADGPRQERGRDAGWAVCGGMGGIKGQYPTSWGG